MTGKELVMYILANNLEDEAVSFMTMSEAAVKFHVGIETIRVWIQRGQIPYIEIINYDRCEYFIPEKAVVKEV